MRRYFLLALIIGALSACVTYLLYEFGIVGRAATKLAVLYTNMGLLESTTQPVRMIHVGVFSLLAVCAAWAVIDIARPLEKGIVIVSSCILTMIMSPLLALFGIFFEPFSSLIAITASALLGLVYSQTEPGRRKGVLEQVLGGRISVLSKSSLLDGAPPEFMNGQNRDVTVLAIRTFNHTQLREATSPAEMVEMTNLFLKHTSDFLISRGAYIDESSPDCVRAFFGVFGRREDNAPFAACEAANKLCQRMANLNSELERRFFNRLDFGISIGTGQVTLGVYRSDQSYRLSAVGEVIEQVRVLSAANHVYGSQILLSAKIYGLIRDQYAVRPMEMILDPKTRVMSEVYELLDAKQRLTAEDEEARKAFWQGVILYREGKGEEALRIFSNLKTRYPHDKPLQYFIERSQLTLFHDDSSSRSQSEETMHGHARVMPTM